MSRRGGEGLLAALLAVLLVICAMPAAAAEDDYQEGRFQTLQAGSGVPGAPDDQSGEFDVKMINAAPVPAKVYTNVVRITFRPSANSGEALCTGTLLNGQHAVLTAGHCSCGVTGSYRFVPKAIFDRDPNADDKAKFTLRAIREPVRFPGFSCAEGANNIGRDLALFFVQDVTEEKKGAAANSGPLSQIASMHTVFTSGARQLTAAGYGVTEDGTFSRTLERGRIAIGSYFCSQGSFAGTPCAGFHEFVLGTVSGGSTAPPVDTCNGDSGGPVFWYPPEQTDVTGDSSFFPPPALVGVTSRALVFADHLPGMLCGGGGVYTAVGHSDVLNWLWSYGVQVRTVEPSINTPTSSQ